MGNADTIKEYLVSLGFDLDNASYQQFRAALEKASSTVKNNTAGWGKSFVEAAVIVTSALASITMATVGLIEHVGQADLKYQEFALHMYMGVKQAREMKIAADALGESLQDIAWLPELRGRYKTLLGEEQGMEAPLEAAGGESVFRRIRDIRFEWTRLKVEMVYGSRYIGFYLMKYLGGPSGNLQTAFHRINNWLQKNMPIWTNKVAQFLSMIINVGKSGVRALKDLWESLNKGGKTILVLGAILTAFLIMGPLGKAIIIFSALLLLVDDFYAYVDGRKSSKTLAPLWGELIAAGKMLTDTFSILDKTFPSSVSSWRVLIWQLGADIIRVTWALSAMVKVLAAGKLVLGGHFKDAREMLESIGSDYEEAAHAIHAANPVNAAILAAHPMSAIYTNDLTNRIGKAESGGNYKAVNKDTGAYGKYQIMPQNWSRWAKEAGLSEHAPTTAANQEIVTRARLTKYNLEFGGDQRLVAAAWYAGESYARALRAGHPPYDPNKAQGKYPSVNRYIKQVTGRTWDMPYLVKAGGVHIDNSVSVGDIHVTHANASAADVGGAVKRTIQEHQAKQTARQIHDMRGVHG